MVFLLEGSPISTEELSECPLGSWSPPWPRPFPPIAHFGRTASSRKSLGGSKLHPFKINGGHCVLGYLQCCRNVLVPFPRSEPRHNPVSELYRQFLRPHGLVFDVTCTVNCGTLYRTGAFPNHVQSSELVDSNQVVETPQGISGNRIHLSSISSLMDKGLNTYINKPFQFFIWNTFANISKNLFLLCHYGVLCVDWWRK